MLGTVRASHQTNLLIAPRMHKHLTHLQQLPLPIARLQLHCAHPVWSRTPWVSIKVRLLPCLWFPLCTACLMKHSKLYHHLHIRCSTHGSKPQCIKCYAFHYCGIPLNATCPHQPATHPTFTPKYNEFIKDHNEYEGFLRTYPRA